MAETEDEVGAWTPPAGAGARRPGAGPLDPASGAALPPGPSQGSQQAGSGDAGITVGDGSAGTVSADAADGPVDGSGRRVRVTVAVAGVSAAGDDSGAAGGAVGGDLVPDGGGLAASRVVGSGALEPGAGSAGGGGLGQVPGGLGPVPGDLAAQLWPEPGQMHRYVDAWSEEWVRDLTQRLGPSRTRAMAADARNSFLALDVAGFIDWLEDRIRRDINEGLGR